MRFETENEVKKWLRGLPMIKKELSLKSEFFKDLATEAERKGTGIKYRTYYLKQIDALHEKLITLENNIEEAFNILDPEERTVMTARYINNIIWDMMEFKIYYSRRQAIRIHNRAIKKLVNKEICAGGA